MSNLPANFDPTSSEMVVVSMTNVGPKPITFEYAKQKYHFPVNVPRNVPYLAMVLWLGNPALRDLSSRVRERRYRTLERERLARKYGTGTDPWYSDEPRVMEVFQGDTKHPRLDFDPFETIDGQMRYRHPLLPRFVVEDYEGNRIVTVLDDPEGNFTFGAADSSPESGEAETLRRQLDQMMQQQQMILSRLAEVAPDAAMSLGTAVSTVKVPAPDVDHTVAGDDDLPPEVLASMEGVESRAAEFITETGLSADIDIDPNTGMSNAASNDPKPSPSKRPVKKAAPRRVVDA